MSTFDLQPLYGMQWKILTQLQDCANSLSFLSESEQRAAVFTKMNTLLQIATALEHGISFLESAYGPRGETNHSRGTGEQGE